MTTYFNLAEPQFRVPNGAGYKVYAYQLGGTSTPISTYSAYTGGTNAYPVVLSDDGDGNGVAPIFLTQSATIKLTDAAGTTITGYPRSFIVPASTESLTALDVSTDGRLDSLESDVSALDAAVDAITIPAVKVCSVRMTDSYRITVSQNSGAKITHMSVAAAASSVLWNDTDSWLLPDTAGWWRVSCSFLATFSHPTNDGMRVYLKFIKNGGTETYVLGQTYITDDQNELSLAGDRMIYFNGTTDYLEIYAYAYNTAGSYYVGSETTGVNPEQCWVQAQYVGAVS